MGTLPECARIFGKPAHIMRGRSVLLDAELARALGVPVARLNRQTRRHLDRFPPGSMFRLDAEEARLVRPPRGGRGGRRHRPWAFAEPGALLAAGLLRTPEALRVCIRAARLLAGLSASRAALARGPAA